MAPGLLEGVGFMDLLVQPIRVQLATTNTAIVQQAYPFANILLIKLSDCYVDIS